MSEREGFCKLWGEGATQVLVTIDEGVQGPEIRVYGRPPGFGICSFALGFAGRDIEHAWTLADKAFELMDEEKARKLFSETVLSRIPTVPPGTH